MPNLHELKDKVKTALHKKSSKDGEASPVEENKAAPLGIANEIATQEATVDSLDEPLTGRMPPHIAQRLEEHAEQHSTGKRSKQDIEKDIELHAERKEQYQKQHHAAPAFDAAKDASPETKFESTIASAALPGIADHEKQFGGQNLTKEQIDKDMAEHEARRQAILDAKAAAAGSEVLEAKKKAEEHNDGVSGVRAEDGQLAPEQPGLFQSALNAIGLGGSATSTISK